MENFRRCRTCEGLHYFGKGKSGVCASNSPQGHIRNGNSENYIVTTTFSPGCQDQWRVCYKCQQVWWSGNGGMSGVCPFGGPHMDQESVPLFLSLNSSSPKGQQGWRWCNRCMVLFYHGSGSYGLCPLGGGHSPSGSGAYDIPFRADLLSTSAPNPQRVDQEGWTECKDSHGLHLSTEGPVKYTVSHSGSPGGSVQANWRWCNKCQHLWWAGEKNGVCIKGGTHSMEGSGDYFLHHNENHVQDGQEGWRYCHKCCVLFNSKRTTLSNCPAGGRHDPSHSGRYTIKKTPDHGQSQWKKCMQCSGLHYNGLNAGRCPAGYGHMWQEQEYVLSHNKSPGGSVQSDWRWCQKCQQLWWAGQGNGVCPSGGNGHEKTGSGNYYIHHYDSSVKGETGWRWCSRCMVLFHIGSGTPSICAAGGPHNPTGSGEYTLRFKQSSGQSMTTSASVPSPSMPSGYPGIGAPTFIPYPSEPVVPQQQQQQLQQQLQQNPYPYPYPYPYPPNQPNPYPGFNAGFPGIPPQFPPMFYPPQMPPPYYPPYPNQAAVPPPYNPQVGPMYPAPKMERY
eukprot:TRINITY_DN1015_c0_g4_i2.p1 TRINITY_DN1015_c0_g4~~TRINITY_DN1015_c0_g4_i2.p1  ORF type:complete len:573 (-),score=82.41 TRINITY_DN1015_c0_g4_i2:527-2206(-)